VQPTRRVIAQALACRIRDLLDRGVQPRAIEAELVRRRMTPAMAAHLVARIAAARTAGAPRPAPRVGPADPVSARRPAPAAARPSLWSRARGGALLLSVRLTRRGPVAALRGATAIALLFAGGRGALHAVRSEDGDRGQAAAVRLAREIDAAQASIARLEQELAHRSRHAERIDSARARLALGPRSFAGPAAYRAAVARYRRAADDWNATLPRYRRIAEEYRALVGVRAAKLDSLRETPGGGTQLTSRVVGR
jgi:hypothetical protein